MLNKNINLLVDADMEWRINLAAAHDEMKRSDLLRKIINEFLDKHPLIQLIESHGEETKNVELK